MDQINISFKGNVYSVYFDDDLQEIQGVAVCSVCGNKTSEWKRTIKALEIINAETQVPIKRDSSIWHGVVKLVPDKLERDSVIGELCCTGDCQESDLTNEEIERELKFLRRVICGDCEEKKMDRMERSFLVEYEPEHTLT